MAKYLIIVYFVASILVSGNGKVLVGPQDIEATTEETVELHCKATLIDVEWQHLAIDAASPEHVYKDGFIYNGYKERFSANNTIDGTNVLIIRNVQPSDAGTFTCLENSETTSRSAAELIVFERVPSNEFCAGKYTCKPVCSELELTCEMKAQGNHIPSMHWIDSEGRQLTSMKVIVNEVTVSKVTLKTDPYVSAWYTCRVKYLNAQLASKYGWTYSTSVTKELESLLKTENQQTEASLSQSTVVFVSSIAAMAVITWVVMAIIIIYQCKMKETRQMVSSAQEINAAAQPLIEISIGGNANDENFVPGNSFHGLTAREVKLINQSRAWTGSNKLSSLHQANRRIRYMSI